MTAIPFIQFLLLIVENIFAKVSI